MQPLYEEFGRLLRDQRDKEGLTQKDISERVGLSRTSITNIELGKQHVSLHLLYKLASAVNTSPTNLLPDNKFAAPSNDLLAEALDETHLDEEAKGWIKKFAVVDTSLRRKK